MISEALGISEEELGQILQHWLYGGADMPLTTFDVFTLAVVAWREVIRLKTRFNQYDAAGAGDLLTVPEVMRITGLSRSSVYRKMKSSTFTSMKAEGRRYIYRSSVEHWQRRIDQHKVVTVWNPWANCPEPDPELDVKKHLRQALEDFPPIDPSRSPSQ